MKCQSYVIRKEDLQDYEYDILVNICGAFDAESSFAVKVPEIKDCLDVTKELNDGSEVMDCVGRTWVPNYDDDIKFMENLLMLADGCDYVIVEFSY